MDRTWFVHRAGNSVERLASTDIHIVDGVLTILYALHSDYKVTRNRTLQGKDVLKYSVSHKAVLRTDY